MNINSRTLVFVIGALLIAGLAWYGITRWRTMPATSGAMQAKVCKCYCSDKCGPRDNKVDDQPFVDKETGLCFCKMRDKENFVKNGCDQQDNEPFKNCCGN